MYPRTVLRTSVKNTFLEATVEPAQDTGQSVALASNVRLSSLSSLLHKLRACKDRVLAVICWILRLKLGRELKQLADADRPDDAFRSQSDADAGLKRLQTRETAVQAAAVKGPEEPQSELEPRPGGPKGYRLVVGSPERRPRSVQSSCA